LSKVSIYGFAENFHFDIMIITIFIVAVAVKTDITGRCASGINKLTLSRFDIMLAGTKTEAGRVIIIVVEECPNVRNKIGVVGNLHNHIIINTTPIQPKQPAIS